MIVKVRLFGNLGKRFPGYDHEEGMDVDLPDGAVVADLLTHLDVSSAHGGLVSAGTLPMKPDDELPAGTTLSIFQPVFGG